MRRRRIKSELARSTLDLFQMPGEKAFKSAVPSGAQVPEAGLDLWARACGFRVLAGVDEVGRGPLAGPVVAAAVVLPEAHRITGLADSKQLTARSREVLAEEITRFAAAVGLGVVGPRRIDQINIRRASLEAMGLALQQVLERGVCPDLVMIDGLDVIPLPKGVTKFKQQAFVKGDARSGVIGAASIVAKVYRDALMLRYHTLFPAYGFDRNKGYPTPDHKRAILCHGPCEIHRRSFAGVLGSPEKGAMRPVGIDARRD